jgi:hypothetical protein
MLTEHQKFTANLLSTVYQVTHSIARSNENPNITPVSSDIQAQVVEITLLVLLTPVYMTYPAKLKVSRLRGLFIKNNVAEEHQHLLWLKLLLVVRHSPRNLYHGIALHSDR